MTNSCLFDASLAGQLQQQQLQRSLPVLSAHARDCHGEYLISVFFPHGSLVFTLILSFKWNAYEVMRLKVYLALFNVIPNWLFLMNRITLFDSQMAVFCESASLLDSFDSRKKVLQYLFISQIPNSYFQVVKSTQLNYQTSIFIELDISTHSPHKWLLVVSQISLFDSQIANLSAL